jgi:hypothetical protein
LKRTLFSSRWRLISSVSLLLPILVPLAWSVRIREHNMGSTYFNLTPFCIGRIISPGAYSTLNLSSKLSIEMMPPLSRES